MPRKPAPAAQIIDPATPESTANWSDSANQLATLNAQAAQAAQAVALQVGYDGTLTVGALEDEIRFYQRRTVEAILETGKRLLVLKALLPHGEFEQRVELLGFSVRTARRFMQAQTKTTKSAILADLSRQAKNGMAFLELVTHDEDVLEDLSKLDDIDRMSASELRAAVRNLRGDAEATEKVLAGKQAEITKLERKLSKPAYTPDQTAADLHKKMVEALGHEMHALHGQIAKVATVVQDVYATGDTTAIEGVNEVVRWAFQSLADVALKHGIEVDFKEIVVPEWMRPMLAGAEATSA